MNTQYQDSKQAIVWSQPNCQYCTMAKALLVSRGYEVTECKIGDGFTKEDFQVQVPGAHSVPQIIINGYVVPRGYVGLKGLLG